MASTPSQTMYFDTALGPFGEPYAQSGTTDVQYTGQNQDTVSGIDDFPARELGQVSGRWPSPDPLGLGAVNPGDPQTWNRYSYVRNSPLFLTDPSGLISCPLSAGACVSGGGGGNDGGDYDENGYCPPWYGYCGDPCTLFAVDCGDDGDEGGGGGLGGPGLAPPVPPSFPLDTQGALSEINGLPAGMQWPGLSPWGIVWPGCSGPPLVTGVMSCAGGYCPTFSTYTDYLNWLLSILGPNVFVDQRITPPGMTPSVPPNSESCSLYHDGTETGAELYNICMSTVWPMGDNYWANCSRGTLLQLYVPNGNNAQLFKYLYEHPGTWAGCLVPTVQ